MKKLIKEETIVGKGFDLSLDDELYGALSGYTGADATVYALEGQGTSGITTMHSGILEFAKGDIIVRRNRDNYIRIHYKDINGYRFVKDQRFIDLDMRQGNTITIQFNV